MKPCTIYRPSQEWGETTDRCDLCGGNIHKGETLWRFHGRTVCRDCFTSFAREILTPYECSSGEEAEG